ncbi:hypothetical protein WJU16_15740 [Chitinophaga pollutisoli]|uniref:Uncharacterized protein n=1 Tax=Chitinophaga pollutisoli TaxID=3133966 RepID=A0ABZ2YKL3_9BACT
MKTLKLHPLMTISLLQMQIQRLLHCNAAVYIRHSLANGFNTLREAGLEDDALIEYPIDETLSLREFEEDLEERFHFSLELCNMNLKPFMNKSLRLFQLPPISEAPPPPARGIDLSIEWLLRQGGNPAL